MVNEKHTAIDSLVSNNCVVFGLLRGQLKALNLVVWLPKNLMLSSDPFIFRQVVQAHQNVKFLLYVHTFNLLLHQEIVRPYFNQEFLLQFLDSFTN